MARGELMTLLALLALAAAGEPGWLSAWGAGLRHGLDDALQPVVVVYDEPNINTTYISRTEFDMRAMGHLYNSTKYIIDLIAKKQAYPEGTVSVADGHIEWAPLEEHWRPLLQHYAGPAAVLAVALLLAVALPLAGLFWCCCYWCRAGRRRRPFDRKCDACLKGVLAIVMIGLLTLFLFGVVCAFATEQQLESGTREPPRALRRAAADARAFLNHTERHARLLLVHNYRQLRDKLAHQLDSMGTQVSTALGEFSSAVSVSTLNRMVLQLNDVQADLRSVRNATAALRFDAERLHAALRKVRAQLLQTLHDCDEKPCRRLVEKHRIGELNSEIQYDQLPDVSALLNNVTALLQTDLQAEVAAGQRVLADIQRGIASSVQRHIPDVLEQLDSTGRQLEGVADDVTARAGNASAWLRHHADPAADTLDHGVSLAAPWRRLAGLAGGGALLAALALLAAGLLCGVCGKRPDGYARRDCCSKAAGSRCLLCGMGVMFVLGGGVALLLAAYFAVGVASQRFICDPLTSPRGNRLFADVERFVALGGEGSPDLDLDLGAVLRRCHHNYTVYEVLSLSRLYSLDALEGALADGVERRVAALAPAFPRRPVQMLSARALQRLRLLAASGLGDFNFDVILDALEQNMTSLALDRLAAELAGTSDALRPRPQYSRVAVELSNAAAALAAYHADIVLPLLQRTAEVNTTVRRLQATLRFGYSSLQHALDQLTGETQHAEVFLNDQGPELVQNLTQEFGRVVAVSLRQYLARLRAAATGRPAADADPAADPAAAPPPAPLGRCGPLSAAYNATRDSVCRNVLMPVNGYWIALSWCVLLFVPLLALAARLARLYRQLEPYPGPLVEAEYLYDAYADRDNVPLANAYKAEKRSRRSPRGGSGGGGGGGGGGGAAGGAGGAGGASEAAPHVDAHHARRYNDMAPKHWEEGPPRYHGPTEYERPPPYYYPGPVDRQ